MPLDSGDDVDVEITVTLTEAVKLTLPETVRLPDEDTDELIDALPLGLDWALTVTPCDADTDTLAESLLLDDMLPV